MKATDYIRTAFKNLFRQKLRTFLTIFAIVIGAISVTMMLSLVLAGKKAIVGAIESAGALKIVSIMPSSEVDHGSDNLLSTSWNSDSKNKIDDTTVEKLKAIPHVEEVAPIIQIMSARTMYLEGQSKKFNVQTLGIDPSKKMFTLKMIAGRNLTSLDKGKIVLTDEDLGNFGYKGKASEIVGKKIIFVSKMGGGVPVWAPDPPKPPMNADSRDYWEELNNKEYSYPIEIVGVASSAPGISSSLVTLETAREFARMKNWGVDTEEQKAWEKANQEAQEKQRAYQQAQQQCVPGKKCTLPPAPSNQGVPFPEQKLMVTDYSVQNGYGSILVKADDANSVSGIASAAEKLNLKATTAQNMIDQFNQLFTVVGAILGGIGSISLLVSAIGIINTMVMATYERTKEIGVLRACGARRSTIRRLFTFEAAFLGFLGGVTGLGVSYVIAKIGNVVLDKVAVQQSLPLEGLITFPVWLVFGVIGFTTLIGMLAGLYPAFRASRMDPITALRYE